MAEAIDIERQEELIGFNSTIAFKWEDGALIRGLFECAKYHQLTRLIASIM